MPDDRTPSMAKLLRLAPQLEVADLRRTIVFYVERLGFTLCASWPQADPSWCMLERDGVQLMFVHGLHAGKPRMSGKLAFVTDDVMAVHERVRRHARIVYGPEVYHYGMKEFALEDPDGYMISFGQETDEPPTCPAEERSDS